MFTQRQTGLWATEWKRDCAPWQTYRGTAAPPRYGSLNDNGQYRLRFESRTRVHATHARSSPNKMLA